ncbi:hypothetical protein [Marinobacterium rhizophilum]|uniref:Uncharacterized protein n=1 Tax=Marinobacterium rhizophilum TaxID=420402 RepID=A0ABY5HK14_9GAMM|nr:hypothetical protein [Marinobacterium rhizophilum]UTW11585.1 hypothetical protein KDW95_20420 [Marinobacterium rhizophilum]
MKRTLIKQWLLRRANKPQQNLLLLLLGFGLFAPGIGLIVAAEFLLAASWQQELLALLGLILSGAGSILAAAGYLSLSLLRLYRFLNDDRNHD